MADKYKPGDRVVLIEQSLDQGQSWAVVQYCYTDTYRLFIVHSTHADYKFGDSYQAPESRLMPYVEGKESPQLDQYLYVKFAYYDIGQIVAKSLWELLDNA